MTVRLLHLVGSPQSEFMAELSRLYAADCLRATADPDRYEPLIAHVAPSGVWCFPEALDAGELAAAPGYGIAEALAEIEAFAPDAMVPQMFCRPGMTTYRGLFDILGIPYPGNPPEVMAIGADKARARALVAAAGVAVADGELVAPGMLPSLEPPVVVKPADADNSAGVSLVRDVADYPAALAVAHEHGALALVERYVELGREVRCGVLEQGGELVCLPLEEYAVDPETRPIRAAADKLARDGLGELGLVAKTTDRAWIVDPADPVTVPVWRAARAAHRALGARHYSLFDFRIDPEGRPVFLEASLYCSFARGSVLATMAAAAGIPLSQLFADCLGQALAQPARHAVPRSAA